MKKGQTVEGLVKRIKFPNEGIVEIPGEEKYLVLKNVLPGQQVRAAVQRVRKGKAQGRLLEVCRKAPCEIEPPCPHSDICGGCTYQNLPYEKQLELKAGQIREIMDSAINGDYIWEGIIPSPRQEGYRNKMEFTFGDQYKDGPMTLGMHKREGFYDIVSVVNCRIVDEDFRNILACTLECARQSGLPYYHRLKHTGWFRHLLVRKAAKTGEILIDIITASGRAEDNYIDSQGASAMLRDWTDKLLALKLDGKIKGVLHTINDGLADAVKDEGTEILYGQDYFYEELLGLKFKITPFSFFQTNSLGAELLYEKAREYIGDTKDKTVFDLYSGTGTIAQILAPVAKRVVGVEIVPEAVEAARENAELNGLNNCAFWAGDVLKIIDDLKEIPDLIILDPPREGVHPKALEKIIAFGADRLVYISCKPTSLARDIAMFQEHGYKPEKIACVDLFPSTYHIETICRFVRNKAAQ